MPLERTFSNCHTLSTHDMVALRHEIELFETDVDRRFNALEDHMDARFATVDYRFEAFDHKLDAMEHRILGTVLKLSRDQILAMVWANIGQLVALGGLLLAAARL